MTNNSPVYWEVQKADGSWFSLHTYSWSVKSFGGRRWTAGAKRGEDFQVPFRRGRLYVPKSRESSQYDINMWVFPTNEDGTRDANKTIEQKAHQNFRKIVDACDQDGQFRLRKRWHDDDSVVSDFGSQTNVVSAIAWAEYLDASGPESDDGRGFYMDLTFALADPYFYGNQILGSYTAADKVAGGATLTTGSNNINLLGDVTTDHIWLNVTNAGTTNPKITFPDGNWIQILTTNMTNPNASIVVDLRSGVAMESTFAGYLDGTPTTNRYYNGLIRRNPYFSNWPTLDPKKYPSSNVQVTATGTFSGTMKLVYDPAYR